MDTNFAGVKVVAPSPLRTGLPQAPRVLFLRFCSAEIAHPLQRSVQPVKVVPGLRYKDACLKEGPRGTPLLVTDNGMQAALSPGSRQRSRA